MSLLSVLTDEDIQVKRVYGVSAGIVTNNKDPKGA